jgi:hypothetical protein
VGGDVGHCWIAGYENRMDPRGTRIRKGLATTAGDSATKQIGRGSIYGLPRSARTDQSLVPNLLFGKGLFIHYVRHLCDIAAVVILENIDQALHRASGHAFVGIFR